MVCGTTPTLIINTNVEIEKIKEVWITFSTTTYEELLTKKYCDCVAIENKLSLTLTQEDTLALNPKNSNADVYVQIRVLLDDGNAFASTIYKLPISRLLKEGYIYAD